MLKSITTYLGKQKRDFKLLKYHFKQPKQKRTTTKKQIIVCFNGVVPHGGLVDRLKGIISFYDIAKQLDYDFFIQFNHPFNLDTFLEPNTFDWSINNVGYKVGETELVNVVNNFDANPLELIKASSKKTFFVYANIDFLAKNYAKTSHIDFEEIWRSHFNTLFKKSAYLANALQGIEANPYISLHTRFTSIMGDFVDSTSVVISEEERQDLLAVLEKEVTELTQANAYKCYAFSDSTVFLNEISKRCKVSVVKGTPFHMDSYKGNADLESHLKTLVDFFMISQSEAVYFIRAGKMYQSAFSKYAAIIGNKPFKRIDVK